MLDHFILDYPSQVISLPKPIVNDVVEQLKKYKEHLYSQLDLSSSERVEDLIRFLEK